MAGSDSIGGLGEQILDNAEVLLLSNAVRESAPMTDGAPFAIVVLRGIFDPVSAAQQYQYQAVLLCGLLDARRDVAKTKLHVTAEAALSGLLDLTGDALFQKRSAGAAQREIQVDARGIHDDWDTLSVGWLNRSFS